jgi:ABC-type methionine transport system ATPase subunit
MSLLSLEHVSKRSRDGRERRNVLEDVSLEVEQGELLGIWGMRGSGKTTLLRVAAGIEPPDQGTVRFDGRDVTRMSADARAALRRRDGISLVWTAWHLARDPVVEHVALGLLSDGMSLREARERAHVALAQLGVSACASVTMDRLSRVERTRVGLAQALVHTPRLLLVDEPSVPLGPMEAVELYGLLRSLGEGSGLSIVVASEEIAAIRGARRMLSIDSGRLRAMDRPGTVVAFPASRRPASRRSRR